MNRQRRCAIVVVVGCVCCGWGAEQRPTVKMDSGEYVAFLFDRNEGWTLRVSGGNGGASKFDWQGLSFDFTKGATSVGIAPRDVSLLGTRSPSASAVKRPAILSAFASPPIS